MMDALLAEGNYSYGEGIFLKKKRKEETRVTYEKKYLTVIVTLVK